MMRFSVSKFNKIVLLQEVVRFPFDSCITCVWHQIKFRSFNTSIKVLFYGITLPSHGKELEISP
jgi:hypothetical protein